MKRIDIVEKFKSSEAFPLRLILSSTIMMAIIFIYKGNNGFFAPTKTIDSWGAALFAGLAATFMFALLCAVAFVAADTIGNEKERILNSDNTVNIHKMDESDFDKVLRQGIENRYLTYEQAEEIRKNYWN